MKKILTLMMILTVCFIPLFAEELTAVPEETVHEEHVHEEMTFPEYLMNTAENPDSIYELSEEEDAVLRKAVLEAVGEYDLTSYESIGMLHEDENITELYLYNNDTYHLISLIVFDNAEDRDEMFSQVVQYSDEAGFTDIDESPKRYVAILEEEPEMHKGIYYIGDIENFHFILSAVIPG